jgi:HK97 family phage prohead protease
MADRYDGLDFSPSKGSREEAERGLRWVEEFGRGGTRVGRTTARLLVSGDPMPSDRVRRMAQYFPRHEVDKDAEGFRVGEDGYPSNGRIAWALWGGDSGWTWSQRKVEQMNRIDEEMKSAAPETKEVTLNSPAMIDSKGNVKGVAAAFGNLDRHGDIILPGAFDRALSELPRPSEVAFLWNHDTSMPLGPLKKLKVDASGLAFEGEVVPTTWGKDVRLLLKTGTVRKMSFGYRVNRSTYIDDAVGLASAMAHFGVRPEWSAVITAEASKAFDSGTGVRLLVDLDPWEVSVVPVPANPRAELVGKGITLDEAKGAAPFRDYAFSALDYEWDPDNAVARVKRWAEADEGANAAYRSAFAWYDTEDAGSFGAYRLPIADVIEGSLVIVPNAVYSAARLVEDGEAGIPDSDESRMKRLLGRYYKAISDRFDDSNIVAPWNVVDDAKDEGLTSAPSLHENGARALDHELMNDDETKAGRVLSTANVKRLMGLRDAMTEGVKALDEVLRLAGIMNEEDEDESPEEDEEKSSAYEHASTEDLTGLFRFKI